MQKSVLIFLLLVSSFFPFFVSAEEGFLWENPGLDFYTKIDEGSFKVLQKTVNKRLQENPMLNQFGKKCVAAELLLNNIPTTSATLDAIENGDYTSFTEKIIQNTKGKGNISTDTFSHLTKCITEEYKNTKKDAQKETDARVNISYLGLYMDGDKSNSEYDIITDIEKINWLIFSEDLKYDGTVNAAGKWFKDFVWNKAITPLFPLANIAANGNTTNPPGNTPSVSGSVTPAPANTTTTASADLQALLGGTCSSTTPIGPVSDIVDDAFLADLAWVLASGGGGGTVGGGYAADSWPILASASGSSTGNTIPSPTSAGDFFHKMPCASIFCIDVKMVPGSTNALGGGKNVSIEGLLDKHIKIMQPISESALGCEVMTNNTASSPKKWLNLPSTLAGLKVFLDENPQKTRRDKKEVTPEKEAQELKDIQKCGNASAGLSTDEARARSIGGAGYNRTIGYTSENVQNAAVPLGPQEAAEIAKFTDCVNSYMQVGRKAYYDSFSTDLTEIQSYTANMLNQINNIVSNLTEMNSKKNTCS